jgi:dihydrofolate reductase
MVDEVYLYKWNRKYPSDVKFPKDMLNDFKLEGSTDFEGNSHEKITEERYVRKK